MVAGPKPQGLEGVIRRLSLLQRASAACVRLLVAHLGVHVRAHACVAVCVKRVRVYHLVVHLQELHLERESGSCRHHRRHALVTCARTCECVCACEWFCDMRANARARARASLRRARIFACYVFALARARARRARLAVCIVGTADEPRFLA